MLTRTTSIVSHVTRGARVLQRVYGRTKVCVSAEPHVSSSRHFASASGQMHPGVYDPRADENYEPPAKAVTARGPRFADFRSDTVTKPTAEMTIAMIDAVVGDDVFGEDPSVIRLQECVCEVTGKEDALYVPSGTMANLIAMGVHCRRGEEIICGDKQHIFVYERGGASTLLSCVFHTLATADDGTFSLDGSFRGLRGVLKERGDGRDVHSARPAVIAVENTHNLAGGVPLPLKWLDEVAGIAKDNGLKLHMDGARLMNAAVATGQPATRIVRDCDSVSLCLSKGLGAPVGSVLAGSREFITEARKLRKTLGGGMRQAGVIAASGIVAVKQHVSKLAADHTRAKSLARGLGAIPGVMLDASRIKTNIVYFDLDAKRLSTDALLARFASEDGLSSVLGDERAARVKEHKAWYAANRDLADVFSHLVSTLEQVKIGSYGGQRLRAVTHHQLTDDDVEALLSAATSAAKLLEKSS